MVTGILYLTFIHIKLEVQKLVSNLGVVKHKPSAFCRKLCEPCMSMRSLLFDLSYSPNLAQTLMSASMRGARAPACSYMVHRQTEVQKKKRAAYT